MSDQLQLRILPEELTGYFTRQTNLTEAFERLGVMINYPCGRCGTCGNCVVTFDQGAPSPTLNEEELLGPGELERGHRLACCATISSDATVTIPKTTRLVDPVILTASTGRDVALSPSVFKFHLEIPEKLPNKSVSEHERVLDVLHHATGRTFSATPEYLRRLPRVLHTSAREITVTVLDDFIVDIESGNQTQTLYGISIDIGTTTVAASLHSLRNGEQLGVAARINPQVEWGGDVVSRLSHVYESPERLEQLHGRIIGCINALVEKLCSGNNISRDSVYLLTVAGNTAMNHLFLRVPPDYISLAPFIPVFRHMLNWSGRLLNIDGNDAMQVRVLPNIGGFVGGDAVAGMIVCGLLEAEVPTLFLDIGTNCEVALASGGQIYAASSPAGPAFEGGCISCGVRAEPGAIYDVECENGVPFWRTIESAPARGMCGSGLVHMADAFKSLGVISPKGQFVQPDAISDRRTSDYVQDRLRTDGEGRRRFLLVSQEENGSADVWLTQQDVREFQLAKAAVSSAWMTLLAEAGLEQQDIRQVYIAGAFGNTIRAGAAHALGLVPNCPIERIHSVGNTSLEGARMILLNRDYADLAERILERTTFVELAGRDDFQETFALELALG